MKENMLDISVDDKYRVVQNNKGRVIVYRHGLEWRDETGDSLILSMAYEIERLQQEAANQ